MVTLALLHIEGMKGGWVVYIKSRFWTGWKKSGGEENQKIEVKNIEIIFSSENFWRLNCSICVSEEICIRLLPWNMDSLPCNDAAWISNFFFECKKWNFWIFTVASFLYLGVPTYLPTTMRRQNIKNRNAGER